MNIKKTKLELLNCFFMIAVVGLLFIILSGNGDEIIPTKDAYWERSELNQGFRYALKKNANADIELVMYCQDGKFITNKPDITALQLETSKGISNLTQISLDGVSIPVPVVNNNSEMRSPETQTFLRNVTTAKIVSFVDGEKTYTWKINNNTNFSRCNTY